MSTTSPVTTAIVPLSQSRYEVMACPTFYADRIIARREEAPNPFSLRGTIIHRVISAYIDHCLEKRVSRDFERFDSLLTGGITGEAREILEGMRESLAIDPERVLGTEMYLACDENLNPIDDSEGDAPEAQYAYEGTIDYLQAPDFQTIEIWDWKSYWQIIDPDTFQSRLYPLLVFLHYPNVQTVRFHLKFVRYGTARMVEFTRERDLENLKAEALAERTRQLAMHQDVAEGRKLAALPGAHCVYCPNLTSGCPIAAINPYSEQTPEDRAKFKAWLTAANKANDAILKDFCNLAPVRFTDANGKVYEAGFATREKSTYPASAVLPILNANDAELAKKVTLSGLTQPLKAKKRAELAKLIEPHRGVKVETKFGITGVDEEEGDAE